MADFHQCLQLDITRKYVVIFVAQAFLATIFALVSVKSAFISNFVLEHDYLTQTAVVLYALALPLMILLRHQKVLSDCLLVIFTILRAFILTALLVEYPRMTKWFVGYGILFLCVKWMLIKFGDVISEDNSYVKVAGFIGLISAVVCGSAAQTICFYTGMKLTDAMIDATIFAWFMIVYDIYQLMLQMSRHGEHGPCIIFSLDVINNNEEEEEMHHEEEEMLHEDYDDYN